MDHIKFFEPLDLRFPSFLHSFHGPFKLLFSSNRDTHQPRSKRSLNCPPFPLRCPKGRHHRNNGLHAFIIAGSAFSLSETHYTAHHIVQNFKIPRFDLQFPGKNPLKYFVSRCENPLIQQCAFSRRCLVDGKLCILKTDNRD